MQKNANKYVLTTVKKHLMDIVVCVREESFFLSGEGEQVGFFSAVAINIVLTHVFFNGLLSSPYYFSMSILLGS